jgi:hypothetical protein
LAKNDVPSINTKYSDAARTPSIGITNVGMPIEDHVAWRVQRADNAGSRQSRGNARLGSQHARLRQEKGIALRRRRTGMLYLGTLVGA